MEFHLLLEKQTDLSDSNPLIQRAIDLDQVVVLSAETLREKIRKRGLDNEMDYLINQIVKCAIENGEVLSSLRKMVFKKEK